jgi:hypothetical protein
VDDFLVRAADATDRLGFTFPLYRFSGVRGQQILG